MKNNVSHYKNSKLFNGIPQNVDFYFVHSYHVTKIKEEYISAKCNYGYNFTAALESGNIFATQFHPEKSQRYGLMLIENFINICKDSK